MSAGKGNNVNVPTFASLAQRGFLRKANELPRAATMEAVLAKLSKEQDELAPCGCGLVVCECEAYPSSLSPSSSSSSSAAVAAASGGPSAASVLSMVPMEKVSLASISASLCKSNPHLTHGSGFGTLSYDPAASRPLSPSAMVHHDRALHRSSSLTSGSGSLGFSIAFAAGTWLVFNTVLGIPLPRDPWLQ